jgi:hypothetical protein
MTHFARVVVNPVMSRLSCSPHPRDKRACLPISTPHNFERLELFLILTQIYSNSF